MTNIMEVRNLSFGYSGLPIFSHVNFTVAPGDFISIIGANGAGKSTLIKLLLGELIPFSGGSIRLFGEDIRSLKDWTRVGYVPQNGFNTGFPATAGEIVGANLCPRRGLLRFGGKAQCQKVQETLALVGMEKKAGMMLNQLSGGQRQRVFIAKALAGNPQLLLLDEPTSGIDAETVQNLYRLLLNLSQSKGLTILMVTHDIAAATKISQRTFCMEEGSLVELDKDQIQEELAHKHKHPPLDNCHCSREGGICDGNL